MIQAKHGEPGSFKCAHGVESFPLWHRAYLREFELAMQEADVANGKDGRIGLPYWDWTDEDMNFKEMLPSIVRNQFAQLPDKLMPADVHTPRINRRSDDAIRYALKKDGVVEDTYAVLRVDQHRYAASTGTHSVLASVEKVHNILHVISGYPMSTVGWASFDILFFLHHCQIDRIYESYLAAHPDSAGEFVAHQANQKVNRADKELEPFVDEKTGKAVMPIDMFKCDRYTYAALLHSM